MTLDRSGQSWLWDAARPVLEGQEFQQIDAVLLAAAGQEGAVSIALAEAGESSGSSTAL